jgi:hypothetical protein
VRLAHIQKMSDIETDEEIEATKIFYPCNDAHCLPGYLEKSYFNVERIKELLPYNCEETILLYSFSPKSIIPYEKLYKKLDNYSRGMTPNIILLIQDSPHFPKIKCMGDVFRKGILPLLSVKHLKCYIILEELAYNCYLERQNKGL